MTATREHIARMPKVELHVHLEGSIRPATLLALAKRHGVALGLADEAAAEAFYRYTDFPAFLRVFMACVRCIRDADDIYRITRELIEDARRQQIVYREAFFSPQHYVGPGLPYEDVLAAIAAARAEAPDVGLNMILDLSRDYGTERAEEATDWAIAGLGRGVVGLGVGGSEAAFPPALFRRPFARAKAAGLRLTAHAGEAAGPESILGALDDLGVERIGHGVRCVEDPALVERLRREGITIEMCPTSNVLTRVVARYEDHPLPRLLASGLRVCVNTDDPPMFGTDLVTELTRLAETFALEPAALDRLTDHAVAGSFLPAGEREALRARIAALRASADGSQVSPVLNRDF